MTMPAAEPAA